MEAKAYRDIKYEKDEATGIVMVTLNTPKRKNAMSPYTFLELFWAVEAMEKDEGARVMILTGAKDPDSNDPTRLPGSPEGQGGKKKSGFPGEIDPGNFLWLFLGKPRGDLKHIRGN